MKERVRRGAREGVGVSSASNQQKTGTQIRTSPPHAHRGLLTASRSPPPSQESEETAPPGTLRAVEKAPMHVQNCTSSPPDLDVPARARTVPLGFHLAVVSCSPVSMKTGLGSSTLLMTCALPFSNAMARTGASG